MIEELAPGVGIGYVSHDVAKEAVLRWHYSKTMPVAKLVKFGLFEQGRCVGVILYGRGASPWLGDKYDLDHTEIAECVRIAMTTHATPVSQALAATTRILRREQPGLRLLVSFADPREGHHGGIYQAANWIYTGETAPTYLFRVHGRDRHVRSAGAMWGPKGTRLEWLRENVDPRATRRQIPPKHRYSYPLDRAIRRLVEADRVPYPPATPRKDQE